MVFGIIPECRSESSWIQRSASPESPNHRIQSSLSLDGLLISGFQAMWKRGYQTLRSDKILELRAVDVVGLVTPASQFAFDQPRSVFALQRQGISDGVRRPAKWLKPLSDAALPGSAHTEMTKSIQ
jgi:hypothetical protein